MKFILVSTFILAAHLASGTAQDDHSIPSIMAKLNALEVRNEKNEAKDAKNKAKIEELSSKVAFLESKLRTKSKNSLRGRSLEEDKVSQVDPEMILGYGSHASLLQQLKDITACISYESGSDTCYFGSGDQGDNWQTHAIMKATDDVQIVSDQDEDSSGDVTIEAGNDITVVAADNVDITADYDEGGFGSVFITSLGDDDDQGVFISANEDIRAEADSDIEITADNDEGGVGSVYIASLGDDDAGVFILAKNDITILAREDIREESGVDDDDFGVDPPFIEAMSMPSDKDTEVKEGEE